MLPSDVLPPGSWRWAIYDRKTRTLYYGPADVHVHLTVADQSGVLKNPPAYYRPGGNILGGYLCRSRGGAFYFDPYSGTFPGTVDGVREAEAALREHCRQGGLSFAEYERLAPEQRVETAR